jgi:hypothetical protein
MKLVALTLLALTSVAFADHHPKKSKPQSHGRTLPAWCVAGTDRFSSYTDSRGHLPEDLRTHLEAVLGGLCSEYGIPDDDIPKWEAKRQALMTQLGMTDADWPDAVAWIVHPEWDVPYDRKKAWSALDPVEQVGLLERSDPVAGGVVYMADALATGLSAAGRFAIVDRCIMEITAHESWAWCDTDIAALDAKKALAEMHADKSHQPIERMTVRMIVDRVQTKLPELQKKIADAKAQDGKLFQIATDTRRDWDAHPPDAKLLAIALAADDARITGKPIDACTDKVWPAFETAVSAIPAKRFGALKSMDAGNLATVILGDRDGYLAATSLAECPDASPALASILEARTNSYWPGFRGPRTAAMSAMLEAGLHVLQVDHGRGPRIESRAQGGGEGVIASAKANGDKLAIEFKKDMKSEDACAEGHDTDHILGVGVTGAIQYEYVCTKYTKIAYDTAPKPQTLGARFATGVKAGVTVRFEGDVAVFVRPSPKADPIAVFGVSVK